MGIAFRWWYFVSRHLLSVWNCNSKNSSELKDILGEKTVRHLIYDFEIQSKNDMYVRLEK